MLDREVTSELSLSVREDAGYDEIYSLGREPKEDFPQSSEREPSTHSPNDEEDGEEEDEGDVEGDQYDEGDEDKEDEEDEEDKGNQYKGVESIGQEDGGARPFILPSIWTVNDFCPMMFDKVFNTLETVTKSLRIFLSIYPENLKSAILGRPQMLACMTPCLLQG